MALVILVTFVGYVTRAISVFGWTGWRIELSLPRTQLEEAVEAVEGVDFYKDM